MEIRIDLDHPTVRGPLTLFPLFSVEPEAASYIPGPDAAERNSFERSRTHAERVGDLQAARGRP